MSNNYNPYQAPQSDVYDHQEPSELTLLDTPQSLSIGSGLSWIGGAWQIFMARPLLWIGVGFIVMALMMTVGAIPLLGNILFIMLMVGMGYMAYLTDNEQAMEIGDLFIAFQERAGNLVWLFFAQLIFFFILLMPTMLILFLVIGGADGNKSTDNPIIMLIFMLIGSIYLCVYGAVVWFSHFLVFFHGISSFQAITYSIKMAFKNLLPMTLYGIVIGILWLLGLLIFGLGIFVVFPLTMISSYVAYKQIATDSN